MFAFLLMMFFAITGLLLDHEDLLPGETTTEANGTLPLALLATPDKLMVVENLRSHFGAIGAVSTFDVDDGALHVEMKGPGRTSEAEIDRKTGKTHVTVTRRGFLVRLDDLHRGKDTGLVWRIVLDVSAILLFVGSLSGILMWIALPRRRKWGVVALVSSLIVCGGIYVWLVP
jgi:hypothetical protein